MLHMKKFFSAIVFSFITALSLQSQNVVQPASPGFDTVGAGIPHGKTNGQKLQISDSGYFEKPGVNVLVFSSQYNGMFYDEKTAGIEIIHHGVRTATGGAVRLQNTPEQWDLIPKLVSRQQYNGDLGLPGI
jgi:hypothetical protein